MGLAYSSNLVDSTANSTPFEAISAGVSPSDIFALDFRGELGNSELHIGGIAGSVMILLQSSLSVFLFCAAEFKSKLVWSEDQPLLRLVWRSLRAR